MALEGKAGISSPAAEGLQPDHSGGIIAGHDLWQCVSSLESPNHIKTQLYILYCISIYSKGQKKIYSNIEHGGKPPGCRIMCAFFLFLYNF